MNPASLSLPSLRLPLRPELNIAHVARVWNARAFYNSVYSISRFSLNQVSSPVFSRRKRERIGTCMYVCTYVNARLPKIISEYCAFAATKLNPLEKRRDIILREKKLEENNNNNNNKIVKRAIPKYRARARDRSKGCKKNGRERKKRKERRREPSREVNRPFDDDSTSSSLLRTTASIFSISSRRRGTVVAVPGDTQLPVQAGSAAGPALHLPREARMGAVLLQGGAARAGRAHAQESTGLHRHESDRPEPGSADISGEQRGSPPPDIRREFVREYRFSFAHAEEKSFFTIVGSIGEKIRARARA